MGDIQISVKELHYPCKCVLKRDLLVQAHTNHVLKLQPAPTTGVLFPALGATL